MLTKHVNLPKTEEITPMIYSEKSSPSHTTGGGLLHTSRLPLLALFCTCCLLWTSDTMAWQCPPNFYRLRNQRSKAVYLGTFQDLLGHKASYFWDTRRAQLIGPLDHQRFAQPPNRVRRPGPAPKHLKAGTVGFLDYLYLGHKRIKKVPTYGFYGRFRSLKRVLDIKPFIKNVRDPFVMGLFIGRYGWTSWTQHARLKPHQRRAQNRQTLGILYTLTTAKACKRVKGHMYRDIGGAYLYTLCLMKTLSTKQLGKQATSSSYHWTDLLPLYARYATKPNAIQFFNKYFLQHGLPHRPPPQKAVRYPQWNSCPPYRWERHGPFQQRQDLHNRAMWQLLTKHHPSLAPFIQKVYTNVDAQKDAYVVDIASKNRRYYVLLLNPSSWFYAEITPKQRKKLTIGLRIQYVSRGPHAQTFPFQPRLAQGRLSLKGRRGSFSYRAKKRMLKALQARLVHTFKTGNLPHQAGMALRSLYKIAHTKSAVSWGPKEFKRVLLSFPGVAYRDKTKTVEYWLQTYQHALTMSTLSSFAQALYQTLPSLYQHASRAGTFAHKRPSKRRPKRTWRAQDMHRAIIRYVASTALFYLANNKPKQAKTWMQQFRTKKKRFYPAGWSTRLRPKSNAAATLRAIEALVAQANNTSYALPPQPSRHDLYLLRGLFSPYAYELRKRFVTLLRKAGYPRIDP
ncbi:MAG: hypothetical protein CL920_28440 [Deltaproteobacteria bacterium]|nr:hypothetical protein [Deltaproteobacteria bacterium]